MIFNRARKKRQEFKDLLGNIKEAKTHREALNTERLEIIRDIQKNRPQKNLTINKNIGTGNLGSPFFSNFNNQMMYGNYPICPYQQPTEEGNEPFGWKKGTVRAMLTIWSTLAFWILVILGMIPAEVAYPIIGMIIGSYFMMRMRMF